jgi:hypothetical protein
MVGIGFEENLHCLACLVPISGEAIIASSDNAELIPSEKMERSIPLAGVRVGGCCCFWEWGWGWSLMASLPT